MKTLFAPGHAAALNPTMSRLESALLAAVLLALLLASFGPAVAQHAQYHAFADQRSWWGVPCVLDVLSNVPFAVAGAWGLLALWHWQPSQTGALKAELHAQQRRLAGLFFVGLLLTALCSSVYHWHPDNAGLALDRLGMVVAFAGLLGLAVADRISGRAGVMVAVALLLTGPLSVAVWFQSGNLLPWVVLQAGGMLLMLCLATQRPLAGAWGLSLGAVLAWYAVAKLLELGDQQVFDWTHGLVSGHSLKHLVAALAAWPVLRVMHNHAQSAHPPAASTRV